MMRPIAVLAVLAALSLQGTGRADPPRAPSTADAKRLQELIRQLGADEFSVREKAARELEQVGAPALEQLRQATKSDDVEVRRAAEELVARVQAQGLSSTMLAPRKVSLDLKDVPVAEAVAQLARQSGYALQLPGSSKAAAGQKITLRVRDVPFWEVLRQLRHQAGLTEQRPAPGAPRSEVLMLIEGQERELADASAGSVRVAVLPAPLAEIRYQPARDGETILILETSAEPRVKAFGMVGVVRVERAIDDQGQTRQVVGIPETSQEGQEIQKGGVIIVGARRLVPEPEVASRQRQVALRVQRADKPARLLRELTGVLTAQAYRDLEEELIVVNNILKAGGTTTKGKKGEEIEIQSVIQQPNGLVQVQARLCNLGGPEGGMRVGLNIRGNVVIRGNLNIGARPKNTIDASILPRLQDAQGHAYQLADHAVQGIQITPAGIAHQVLMTYRSGAGQMEPAKLVLRGQQLVVFEVPFTLKNIPLP